MDKSKKNNTEIGLMITALVVLGVFLVFMILNPKKTIGGIGGFFQGMIGTLGPLFLLLFRPCTSVWSRIQGSSPERSGT